MVSVGLEDLEIFVRRPRHATRIVSSSGSRGDDDDDAPNMARGHEPRIFRTVASRLTTRRHDRCAKACAS